VKRAAFTLIEILVTLVILSTGIVMVLSAFDSAVRALGESRDALWAVLILREDMSAAEGGALPGGRSPLNPEFETDAEQRDVTPPECVAGTNLWREVRITVRRVGTPRGVTAATVLRAPPEAPSG
jgi:prepilin-type N-terminal cleavage/methylation domain-containing protein